MQLGEVSSMCVTFITFEELLVYFRERLEAIHKKPSKLNFELYWDAVKLIKEYRGRVQ